MIIFIPPHENYNLSQPSVKLISLILTAPLKPIWNDWGRTLKLNKHASTILRSFGVWPANKEKSKHSLWLVCVSNTHTHINTQFEVSASV